jgi:hypothetical protein
MAVMRPWTLRAFSWLFQKPSAVVCSSSAVSSEVSFGTSKIPPERSEARLQGIGIERLHVGDDGFDVVHWSKLGRAEEKAS